MVRKKLTNAHVLAKHFEPTTLETIYKEFKHIKRPNLISVSNSEWYSLLKDEIRNSIAIEGVFTNRNDLLDVLERNKRTNKQKTAAILGYFESASSLYEYANNQVQEKEFMLRMSDIKQIHTLLMRYEKEFGSYKGDIGEFRKEDVQVAHATFESMNSFYIRDAMELLIEWVNAKLKDPDYNGFIIATISHVWFETIHPFRDGNGRSGRILLSYILIGTGLINIEIKGISKFDREEYYKALEVCDDCFEEINRAIVSSKKFSIKDIDEYIAKADFSLLINIVVNRVKNSIHSLQKKSVENFDKIQNTLVPLRELAVHFNYSQDYLRNLINRGQLSGVKQKNTWYVKVIDLVKYIDSLKE